MSSSTDAWGPLIEWTNRICAGRQMPPIVALVTLVAVAIGSMFWPNNRPWISVASVVTGAACLLVLGACAHLDSQLLALTSSANPDRTSNVIWSSIRLKIIGGAVLFLVIGGELLPRGKWIFNHVRPLVLLPACALLLSYWRHKRRSLSSLRLHELIPRGASAMEDVLSDAAVVAVGGLSTLAIGNMLFPQNAVWSAARAGLPCLLILAIFRCLHSGLKHVDRIAETLTQEQLYPLSRDWAVLDSAARDQSWSTKAILEALSLGAGMRVADVGTGAGYFAIKMAEQVGPAGVVIATDTSVTQVTRLRERAQRKGLERLEVDLVDPKHPLRCTEPLHRILLANVYLFSMGDEAQGRAYLEEFADMLYAGGRLVIYNEHVHEAGWVAAPQWPPLPASQPDAGTVIRWATVWYAVLSEIGPPPPPPGQPLGTHEKPGYLIVLERR